MHIYYLCILSIMIRFIWMKQTIVKRLKLIKELINNQDFHELKMEIDGLKKTPVNERTGKFQYILNSLEDSDWKLAKQFINAFVNDNTVLQHQENVPVLGLKTKSKLLETELSVLVNKKAELSRLVTNFRLKHHSLLGTVISEILHTRKELFMMDMLKKNPDKESQSQKKYEQAKKEYEDFKKSSEFSKKQAYKHISEENKKLLQKYYRQASKLCHPDVVNEEMREEAVSLFSQLNNAYFGNDLYKVKEIYDLLVKNIIKFNTKSETINERERLENLISKLQNDILTLKQEIKEIKQSEAYQTIETIEDWDGHFKGIKEKLQKELNRLKERYEQKKQPASKG